MEYVWKHVWNMQGMCMEYKCNIYEQEKESGYIYDEEKKQQNAQWELDRFSFYLRRHDNHLKSRKVATYLRTSELRNPR